MPACPQADFAPLNGVFTYSRRVSDKQDTRQASVKSLKGVGPKLQETLARLGIATLGDLLMHMPVRYAKIAAVRPLDDFEEGDLARVEVKVTDAFAKRGAKVPTVFATAEDENGVEIKLVWFGRPWLAKQLPGQKIVVAGELEGRSRLSMAVKEFEFADKLPAEARGEGLRPIYRLTEGISQDKIYQLIEQAFAACPRIPEWLPPSLRERYGLPPLRAALRMIHFPDDRTEPPLGRRRLVFDELFPSQLALLLLRRRDDKLPAVALTDDSLAATLIERLPFQLSRGQERAWWRLGAMLTGERPARALIQGEVGAGKTVLAGLAAARAAASKRLAVILAPTETLALQHAASLGTMLAAAGIELGTLLGSTAKEERELLLQRLEAGELHVVIGTHALFSADVLHRYASRLAVVIVDEQQRFGVAQRHALVDAAAKEQIGVHFLQLSATPIPRTLAMTAFGDLDVIDLPLRETAKRKVKTAVAPSGKDAVWVKLVRESVGKGEGVYVVAPRVEDDGSTRAVLSAKLTDGLLGEFRTAVAHGKQRSDERQQAIESFASGESEVLVATTVIEVGIDVARASGIVILDADRFGLATLHQLRGRVGRAGQEAWCVVVPSTDATPEAKARLESLAKIHDGKQLAEIDLHLRGAGEMVGEAQAGRSEFRIASLDRDSDKRVLAEARRAARKLLEADPRLADADHSVIRKRILAQMTEMLRVGQS